MATSGSYDYTTSASTIIKGALRLVGAISQGEEPTAAQSTEAMEALNMMVKAYANRGMPLWAIRNTVVSLVEGSRSYEVGLGKGTPTTKPLKVSQAFYSGPSGIDVPMRVITRDEYERLGNKDSQGVPIQLYYEPLRDYGVVHIFPTPDAYSAANITVTIINQRTFEDFDVTTDEPDFPQEWFEALKYGLAVRLAGEYGIDGRTRMILMKEAEEHLNLALSFDQEEGSIYFQAERRDW